MEIRYFIITGFKHKKFNRNTFVVVEMLLIITLYRLNSKHCDNMVHSILSFFVNVHQLSKRLQKTSKIYCVLTCSAYLFCIVLCLLLNLNFIVYILYRNGFYSVWNSMHSGRLSFVE